MSSRAVVLVEGRFLSTYGAAGANATVAGLCDQGEEPDVRRALERAGLAPRPGGRGWRRWDSSSASATWRTSSSAAWASPAPEATLAAHGKLGAFRTYQKQPAHRARETADQLRGFLTNWKVELAGQLVEALEPDRVPRPLEGVLRASGWRPSIRVR